VTIRTGIVRAVHLPFYLVKAALITAYIAITFPIVLFMAHQHSVGAILEDAVKTWKEWTRYRAP
jgi:hypothetical protein